MSKPIEYVCAVPDVCDRITWRGGYIHLPLPAELENLRTDLKVTKQAFESLKGERNDIKAQRDQLRAEVAGLRTGYEAYEQVNAELKAEVELLESSRAKLAGELSRLRAKHKDWSVIAALGQGEQS